MRDKDQYRNYNSAEEEENAYLEALELMEVMKNPLGQNPVNTGDIVSGDVKDQANTKIDMVEIHKETEDETTDIRLTRQTRSHKKDYSQDQSEDLGESALDAVHYIEDELDKVTPVRGNEIIEHDGEATVVESGGHNVVIEDGVPVGPISDEAAKEVAESVEDDFFDKAKEDFSDSDEDDTHDVSASEPTPQVDPTAVSVGERVKSANAQIRFEDVDGDGEDEIVIDRMPTQQPPEEDDDEDEDGDDPLDSIMNSHEEVARQENPNVNLPEEDEVVFSSTTDVTDRLSIENRVHVKTDKATADQLRQELMQGQDDDGIDDDRVNELAKDYSHLEDDEDDPNINRFRAKKDWK